MSWTRTNLGQPNTYFRVTKPFLLWRFTGESKPTNCYYGSSQIYEAVAEEAHVEIGGEIHNLCGGIFYVAPDGSVSEAILRKSDKSPFEKTYAPARHDWPLDCLEPLVLFRPVGDYRSGK